LIQGLLIQSLLIFPSEFEILENIIPFNKERPFSLGISHSRFDDSLDILNYSDKLKSTKPVKANTDNVYLSYVYKKLKFAYEFSDSSGTVTRSTQPFSLKTNVDSDSFFIGYNFFQNESRSYELSLFSREEKQDPLVIDCYAFGNTVLGGSCEEAKVRSLNSEIYKSTGELVYEPVLRLSGDSDTQGIVLRITSKSLGLLNFNHSFTFTNSTINQSFQSNILNTTDQFIRNTIIEGQNAGELLDRFKNELPQRTPWKENTFKYSVGNLIPLGDNFAFSGMYTFIKVNRNDYLNNPNKEDFTKNHVMDLSLFYRLSNYGTFYVKVSAFSNYLLGVNPLAYNRRSNHLFDHPYGQINAGLIFNF